MIESSLILTGVLSTIALLITDEVEYITGSKYFTYLFYISAALMIMSFTGLCFIYM